MNRSTCSEEQKMRSLLEQIKALPESSKNMGILEDIVKELALYTETEQATFTNQIRIVQGKE